eukprot:11905316-Ditylum_brightwellii.AAC.2
MTVLARRGNCVQGIWCGCWWGCTRGIDGCGGVKEEEAGFVQDKNGSTSKPILGFVDEIGTAYGYDMIATGFGSYLALPILREKYPTNFEEGDAQALLKDCMH